MAVNSVERRNLASFLSTPSLSCLKTLQAREFWITTLGHVAETLNAGVIVRVKKIVRTATLAQAVILLDDQPLSSLMME